VKLVTVEDQTIGCVSIAFSGQSKVILNQNYGDLAGSSSDCYSCGLLFNQQFVLYRGKYTHHKGTYAWPFSFRIPQYATPRMGSPCSRAVFQRMAPWKGDLGPEPHPLPPSMSFGGNFSCSVEYALQATLDQPPGNPISMNKNLGFLKTIKVRSLALPPSIESEGDWPYLKYRHKVRCPLLTPNLTTANRILSKLGHGTLRSPDVELRISVLLPKAIEVKAQSALSILVSASAHVSTDIIRSPHFESEHTHAVHSRLTIRSFKVSLVQHTHVRAGAHRPSSDRKTFVRKGSCVVPVSQGPSTASNVESGARRETPVEETIFVHLSDTADLIVPMPSLVPDFSTYNIARSYTLDIVFRMEYENKKFKYTLNGVPIRVLSTAGLETNFERHLSHSLDMELHDASQRPASLSHDTQGQAEVQGQMLESPGGWVVRPPDAGAPGYAESNLDLVDTVMPTEPPPAYTARP
jgi:hypothetical protein